MDNLKISFFTTCGNRLNHLQQTLPKNIESNFYYNNCEHIVLDYGSTDGLLDWIQKDLIQHVESGRLKVFRYDTDFFWHNHAKNMAAKCTSQNADVICSIDADNYTAESKEGESLASYLDKIFGAKKGKFFVRACGWDYKEKSWENDFGVFNKNKYHSASGKLAFLRKDFFEVRGFNEDLKGHYYDEEEIWRRLMICWEWEKIDLPVEYSKFINHSNYLRLSNLDPEIIDKTDLIKEESIDFTVKDYMDDDLALPIYPQAKKNKDIFFKVLEDKIKIPNGKRWGEGKVKRIKF